MSWKFEVNIEPAPKVIAETDLKFARQVRVKGNNKVETESNRAEVMFEFSASSRLKAFQQRTVWQYRLRNQSSYNLEVVKNDIFDVNNIGMVPRSQWEAMIRSDRWEPHFSDKIFSQTASGETEKIESGKLFPAEADNGDEDSRIAEVMAAMNEVGGVLSTAAVQ